MYYFKSALYNILKGLLSLFKVRTVGARALVIRDEKDILLVKHTYTPGWYTVGGGIDVNESGQEAIIRELFEEAGVVPLAPLELFGFYHNPWNNRDDYIALYVCKKFRIENISSGEISEISWFSLDSLPKDTTPATRKRIEEYLGKKKISDKW